jgi:hypothetical protein
VISPLWSLVPIAVEILWAFVWLPKARTNLAAAYDEDGGKIHDKGPLALGGEMLVGLALVIYHLPVLAPVSIAWGSSRIPYRVIVTVVLLTAVLYSGVLLLLAIG